MCHMAKFTQFAPLPRVFFRCVRDGTEESLPTPGFICAYAAFFLDVSETELKKAYRRMCHMAKFTLFAIMPRFF
jgi:hypothetical protein